MPDHLARALCGYFRQLREPDEILVADDGSGSATRRVVQDWSSRLPLRHVWQEKSGFGKCAVLNKAIGAACGDYLIFSDGDCIPEPAFLQVHASEAAPGQFLSGGAIRLGRAATERLRQEDVVDGRIFTPDWLARNGVRLRERLKLSGSGTLRRLINRASPTQPTFNGNNASAWRSDVVRVNGFDERMVYGGLDRDLGERLERVGVRGRSIRYAATLIHLDHPRSYKSSAGMAANLRIRTENRFLGRSWTPYGLQKGEDSGR
ncbi:glycosyltransferase [Aquibium microcysteis]|uniref:glycosyltransferase n=1 Tax=Aquibium microcysteis TaxID=675281 RepID=UPI00165D11C0|nr:glycosyltransferase [Aquibium microcysteis]